MKKSTTKPAVKATAKTTAKIKRPSVPVPELAEGHHDHHNQPADILVAKVASPLGTLLVYSDAKGLVALDFPGAEVAGETAVVAPKARESLKAAAGSLSDYFAKSKPLPKTLRSALDGTPFQKKVWAAIEKIPFGKTKSYGEIAAQIGHPGASRAVGAACGANPLPLFVPCHRVLAVNGKIGGFSGGLAVKKLLLRHEGVDVKE